MIDWIASADDPRLDPYRRVADPGWIREQGLFVAEGRLVVERLLALDRFRVHSILVNRAAGDAMRPLLAAAQTTVLACDDPTLESITSRWTTLEHSLHAFVDGDRRSRRFPRSRGRRSSRVHKR